jgi:hypothetical protein
VKWYKANGCCVEFTYNKSRYTTEVLTSITEKERHHKALATNTLTTASDITLSPKQEVHDENEILTALTLLWLIVNFSDKC